MKKVLAYMAIISLMICGCQADGGGNVEPEQSRLPECQKTIQDNNDYSKALTVYDSFMRGDIGLNNNPDFTIAPASESKYAVLDMNDDGIPELAVTTVIFQERNSETLELESTFFDSTIFSYKDGEVFIWGGGNQRHNPFEILSNKALLYDFDDGHGGREIIYHELDENGDIAYAIEMWNSSDGRYYSTDYAQSNSQVEISEEEWRESVDSIMAMRTDMIPWSDFPENQTKDLTSAEQTKTPQQALLEEQPVDDAHDAFLIDTGGRLGTLLITAELDEEALTEDCRATVRLTVWNPDAMDEPLQTIMAGTNIFLDWSITDANFDGYADFTCTYLRGNQPYYDHLWIWSEERQQFEGVPEYDEISVPDLDEETKTIYGFTAGSGGGTGLHTFHQWAGGNLLCMRQIEIYHVGRSDTVRMSIQDRIANEMVEIYHEDFSSESSGWLDAQMVWHDLDYHGEPGGIYDIFQQQLIDDTHDAFLVSTGGRLGTLLVTAELAMENKDEFGTRDITFSVWNPADMELPVQTFSEEFMMGVAPEFHHVVDADFDGFQDFGYLFFLGNQPNYYHYWLWDKEYGQFKYCAPLSEISQAVFDPERQVVTGWARSSGAGDGVTTFHRWEDGELVCVRRVESFSPWGEPSVVSVQDRIDGELQQVYREEFPWPGEEPEGQEAWRQAQHKWCDLDYYGEVEQQRKQ